jgi:hypothetical protein
MSTRYVFPELFHAAGAPVLVNNQPRLALRWILHTSLGLPRALFHVGRFEGEVNFEDAEPIQEPIGGGRLVSWADGRAAVAVELTLSVPGGTVVLKAHSAARGAGHVVDERSIVGPVPSLTITLTGNPVASVTVMGAATILSVSIVPMQVFVNDPGWKLIETVGLPVSSLLFDASGYPLDPQGPVGAEVDPIDAAARRVKEGTPDVGWPANTDRGAAVTPFTPPDPAALVEKELAPLMEGVNEVFVRGVEPSRQAEEVVEMVIAAPRSVHGTAASSAWQARARPAKINPLGSLLVAAGSDPFAALALGFATTVDAQFQGVAISRPTRLGIYMVTVEHEVRIVLEEPFAFEFVFAGELAAVYLGLDPDRPSPPTGLTARAKLPAGATGIGATLPHMDPPGSFNGHWLQTVQVSWGAPVIDSATDPRPSGYTIAKGLPAAAMDVLNEKRLSGGWVPIVPASATEKDSPTSIRFADTGVAEPLPGDPEDLVYSVSAQDWFGRWSDWVSADYHLISVAPQVPAVRKVDVLLEGDILPTMDAAVAIEFTWDWSYRSPAQMQLRVLTHLPGTAPPATSGSVFSVGGPAAADHIIDFSAVGPDTPPLGVQLIGDETQGDLRTYRVELPGLELAFGSHPRIRVTARARATESVAPGRFSAWSRDVDTDAISPISPPAPMVPAPMQWASVPDPRGVARTELRWSSTAPLYAVYEADETALRRELNEPSADLETPAADRLVALRALDFTSARRAFRRIADRVPVDSLEIALPRGSRLIHFYGIVPISSTGVEGTLPASANNYFAVAAPIVKTPEQPIVIARDRGGGVALTVEVAEPRVQAGKIEVYRAPSRHRAATIETMGPPVATVDASLGIRADGLIRWELDDATPGVPWQSTFYRAVAYGETVRDRGEYGGRSLPSRSVEVVPSSALPPSLTDLQVEDLAAHPDHRLVSFVSTATLARTPYGAHAFMVQTIGLDARVATRRMAADELPLFSALPTPGEQPDTIFRFDPTNPRGGRTYAWILRDVQAVVVEVRDPAGRSTQASWEVT